MKAISHSMNADGVGILLRSGGSTSTLYAVTLFEHFALRSGGEPKT